MIVVGLLRILGFQSFHLGLVSVAVALVHLAHRPVEHYECQAPVYGHVDLQPFDVAAVHEEGVDNVQIFQEDCSLAPVYNHYVYFKHL